MGADPSRLRGPDHSAELCLRLARKRTQTDDVREKVGGRHCLERASRRVRRSRAPRALRSEVRSGESRTPSDWATAISGASAIHFRTDSVYAPVLADVHGSLLSAAAQDGALNVVPANIPLYLPFIRR